jgi:hypothetical protein
VGAVKKRDYWKKRVKEKASLSKLEGNKTLPGRAVVMVKLSYMTLGRRSNM